jgi:hypothetical protein
MFRLLSWLETHKSTTRHILVFLLGKCSITWTIRSFTLTEEAYCVHETLLQQQLQQTHKTQFHHRITQRLEALLTGGSSWREQTK